MLIHRIKKRKFALGNLGFSLVELIISITILAIIMIPLLSSFIRSAQLNKKAKDIQEQSNLSASIMEGLKNLNINDTIDQFTGAPADFDIIDLNAGSDIKILKDNLGTLEEINPSEYDTTEEYEALCEQAAYHFAIDGIKIGGTAYDALITMESAPFQVGAILDNYAMPDAINLDIMANGVLFSDGRTTNDISQGLLAVMDSHADQTFSEWGEAYARDLFENSSEYINYLAEVESWENSCEEALMQVPSLAPPAPPTEVVFDSSDYPDYFDLHSKITKNMKITVGEITIDGKKQNTIQYEIDYSCDWPADCSLEPTITYSVSMVTYALPVDNVYLYYLPSVFNMDVISIDNQTTNQALRFFLAYQGTDSNIINFADPVIEYNKTADSLSVFTNLTSATLNIQGVPGTINSGKIVATEQKNRIYNTKIEICKYAANAADKYQDVLYTLSSATEN